MVRLGPGRALLALFNSILPKLCREVSVDSTKEEANKLVLSSSLLKINSTLEIIPAFKFSDDTLFCREVHLPRCLSHLLCGEKSVCDAGQKVNLTHW